MILGIGIDCVDIDRFISWRTFSMQKLHRVFSEQEIAYCLSSTHTQISAERFAAHFATREAL